MALQLGIIESIIKGCQKKASVNVSENNFYGLWNVTNLSVMAQPERLPLFFYSFFSSGVATIEADLKPYSFSAGDIMRLRPGQTMQVLKVSEDFCCSLFIFDKKVVSEMIAGIQVPLGNTSPLMHTSLTLQKNLSIYLSMLFEKLELAKKDNSPYIRKGAEQIMKAMLCEIFYEVSRDTTTAPQQTSRSQDIFLKFSSLVSEHFRRERSVNFYAEQLKLTPKYLCRVVGDCVGASPSQYIDQKVMVEAKFLLTSTEKPVAEISEELNFANQSFFAKYFKTREGCSPLAYRNNKSTEK